MKPRAAYLALLMLSVFIFAGCGTELNLYEIKGSDMSIREYQLLVPESAEQALDRAAETNNVRYTGRISYVKFTKQKDTLWTVADYIYALQLRIENSYAGDEFESFTVVPTAKSRLENGETAKVYSAQVRHKYDSLELAEINQPIYPSKKGFYFYEYSFKTKSPLDGLRPEFDSATEENDNTVFGIINSGWYDYITVSAEEYGLREAELKADGWVDVRNNDQTYSLKRQIMPSFREAFPTNAPLLGLTPENLDKVKLSYNLITDRKLLGGEKFRDANGTTFYRFRGLFDETEKLIEYRMVRANSVGWNVTAILAGFAAIGLVMLILYIRKKNEKKRAAARHEDYFPYDPFADL